MVARCFEMSDAIEAVFERFGIVWPAALSMGATAIAVSCNRVSATPTDRSAPVVASGHGIAETSFLCDI
jgi:hypothetical protein